MCCWPAEGDGGGRVRQGHWQFSVVSARFCRVTNNRRGKEEEEEGEERSGALRGEG